MAMQSLKLSQREKSMNKPLPPVYSFPSLRTQDRTREYQIRLKKHQAEELQAALEKKPFDDQPKFNNFQWPWKSQQR